MEKFKKAFRFQLKFLPILGLIIIVVGSIWYEINKRSYEEVETFKEFTKLALDNNISNFTKHYMLGEERIEMKLSSGEAYFHVIDDYNEERDFHDKIMDTFQSGGITSRSSFYLSIPYIFGLVVFIFLFNIVILWFIALYDLFKSEFKENHNKWIWFISMIFLPFIAPLYYLFISEKQKRF